uniref:Uncharacterized protein n=1 Tax=Bursaphelenchus xylophilus TaxID=6326 RepID=A0A1I7RJI1_BURXY
MERDLPLDQVHHCKSVCRENNAEASALELPFIALRRASKAGDLVGDCEASCCDKSTLFSQQSDSFLSSTHSNRSAVSDHATPPKYPIVITFNDDQT